MLYIFDANLALGIVLVNKKPKMPDKLLVSNIDSRGEKR